jgi:hypothetical protein
MPAQAGISPPRATTQRGTTRLFSARLTIP